MSTGVGCRERSWCPSRSRSWRPWRWGRAETRCIFFPRWDTQVLTWDCQVLTWHCRSVHNCTFWGGRWQWTPMVTRHLYKVHKLMSKVYTRNKLKIQDFRSFCFREISQSSSASSSPIVESMWVPALFFRFGRARVVLTAILLTVCICIYVYVI